MSVFKIQDVELQAEPDPREGTGFPVQSVPRPYTVDWLSHQTLGAAFADLVAAAKHPLLVVDRRITGLYADDLAAFAGTPRLEIDASESFKTVEGALALCEFLDANRATKSTTVFVIGGGITQDVAGFGCAIYKRGIPWVYVPTTFLAQGDSGMGGKAGLNYKGSKNILALFSAPRKVVIHSGFLRTLNEEDVLSGLGEVFRLHVTGGREFLPFFEDGFARFKAGDPSALDDLLVSALAVKRAVIERDEFEVDIRRAMNYGHSMGHALEALTDYAIPHGTAVVVGMLIENQISASRGMLSEADRLYIQQHAQPLISERVRQVLKTVDVSGILDILGRDKKSEGKVLKLAVVERIGQIRFIDLVLEPETIPVVEKALGEVLAQF